jgi:hypothetical protein
MATKLDGWSWVDPAQTTIELCGAACTLFKTGLRTNIIVEFGCVLGDNNISPVTTTTSPHPKRIERCAPTAFPSSKSKT